MTSEKQSRTGSSPGKEGAVEGGSHTMGEVTTEAALERFARSFESSAKRWELVVYPSLFAFIILAIYGFYLVFSLTQDMHTLAKSMDPEMGHHMEQMATNMVSLSKNIDNMNQTMDRVIVSLEGIEGRIININGNMDTMEAQLSAISESMSVVTATMQEVSMKMNALEPMRLEMNAMNVNMNRMAFDMNKFTRPESVMMPFMR